jgi:hypothetical protein
MQSRKNYQSRTIKEANRLAEINSKKALKVGKEATAW